MADGEEWISAVDALRILNIPYGFSARETICKRAHVGIVRARAVKILRDDKPQENTNVPKKFWWAGGQAALEQNWQLVLARELKQAGYNIDLNKMA